MRGPKAPSLTAAAALIAGPGSACADRASACKSSRLAPVEITASVKASYPRPTAWKSSILLNSSGVAPIFPYGLLCRIKPDKSCRRYVKIVARVADNREEKTVSEQQITEKGYAHPDALVTTDWVAEHLGDTENVRIVESDEDVLLYDIGHVPNAVKIDWVEDLKDPITRDYVDPEH